jgi:hypothetical protein
MCPAKISKNGPKLKQIMYFGFYLLMDSLLDCRVEINTITFSPDIKLLLPLRPLIFSSNIFGHTLDCPITSFLIGTLNSTTPYGTHFGNCWVVILVFPLHFILRLTGRQRLSIIRQYTPFTTILQKTNSEIHKCTLLIMTTIEPHTPP